MSIMQCPNCDTVVNLETDSCGNYLIYCKNCYDLEYEQDGFLSTTFVARGASKVSTLDLWTDYVEDYWLEEPTKVFYRVLQQGEMNV